MKKLFTIIIILFSFQINAGQIKITTSITPIASIIANILGNEADIKVINEAAGCPHHYCAKFSDLEKIKYSDYLIYIDDSFDQFAYKLSKNFEKNIVKISSIAPFEFLSHNQKTNWHFWLDLTRVKSLTIKIADIFIKDYPDLAEKISINRDKFITQLKLLEQSKQLILDNFPVILSASRSLDYFFENSATRLIQIDKSDFASLHDYQKIQQLLSGNSLYPIMLNISQSDQIYASHPAGIIKINSENWICKESSDNGTAYQNLFFDQYSMILKELQYAGK